MIARITIASKGTPSAPSNAHAAIAHDGGGDQQVDQRVRELAEEPPPRRKRLLGFELVAAVALQPVRRLGRRELDTRIGVELGDDLSGIALPVVGRAQASAGVSWPLPFCVTSATR
jgi:hypothetical protein